MCHLCHQFLDQLQDILPLEENYNDIKFECGSIAKYMETRWEFIPQYKKDRILKAIKNTEEDRINSIQKNE